jgi:DNA primase
VQQQILGEVNRAAAKGIIANVKQIKERVCIVDVIGNEVYLKRAGKQFAACCPFHEDRTPSFVVFPDSQRYKCFGCGASGDSIEFLKEYKGYSFVEAIESLANLANLSVEFSTVALSPERQQQLAEERSLKVKLQEILAMAVNLYQHQLYRNTEIVSYLRTRRRLTPETIQSFSLGYAPKDKDFIYRALAKQRGIDLNSLYQAGLINKKSEDFFSDRLIIPICNAEGVVIALGGRSLDEQVKPKYLNSPDSLLFTKSSCLFGLDKAKQSIRKNDQVILAEGYFDVMALHQVGIDNAIAVMGSSVTEQQVIQLARYTSNFVLCLDSDQAGKASTQKLGRSELFRIFGASQADVRVFIYPALPDNPNKQVKDSDEFLKHYSPDSYIKRVTESTNFLEWLIDASLSESFGATVSEETPQVFVFKVNLIATLLSAIADSTVKGYYLKYASGLLAKGNSNLEVHYSKIIADKIEEIGKKSLQHKSRSKLCKRQGETMQPVRDISSYSPTKLESLEEKLLQAWLHYPCHRELILEELEERGLGIGDTPVHRELWQEMIRSYLEQGATDDITDLILYLTYSLTNTDQASLIKLKRLMQDDGSMASHAAVRSVLAQLELYYLKLHWQTCSNRSNDPYYWSELSKIKARRDELEKDIFALSLF